MTTDKNRMTISIGDKVYTTEGGKDRKEQGKPKFYGGEVFGFTTNRGYDACIVKRDEGGYGTFLARNLIVKQRGTKALIPQWSKGDLIELTILNKKWLKDNEQHKFVGYAAKPTRLEGAFYFMSNLLHLNPRKSFVCISNQKIDNKIGDEGICIGHFTEKNLLNFEVLKRANE